MSVLDAVRGVAQGLDLASGNTAAASSVQQQFDQERQQKQQALQLALTPLQESLRADQTRLALYANPDDPTKPLAGKENEYNSTLNRMTQTIGKMRSLYGQKPQGPNPVEAGAGNLLDKLHITNHLKNHVADARAAVEAKYQGQTQDMAEATAAGALPFAETAAGQAEAKKAADAQALEAQRAAAAQHVEDTRAQAARDVANTRQTTKTPKGMKAMEQGGVAFGVMDQDTGKQYLPSQLAPNGDAPPEAKQIWATIQDAQAKKQAEQDKKDQERDKRLANTLGNMGTWTIAEDGNGNTTLYNSKTGQTKEAPAGLHKSGYFAKQIAPLEAAKLNISSYIDGNVFDGPGDLALQHEFFTATQPATGFRMTKVQQDILQSSQSWMNSIQGKLYHTLHGTWFSDEQRQQIAKAAQEAIENKKRALAGSAGGPKTEHLRTLQHGGKPAEAVGTVTYQGKKYWVDKDKNNLGEVAQ